MRPSEDLASGLSSAPGALRGLCFAFCASGFAVPSVIRAKAAIHDHFKSAATDIVETFLCATSGANVRDSARHCRDALNEPACGAEHQGP